jgi:hypothetical protein
MNDIITIIAIVLFGIGVIWEILGTRESKPKITSDFAKLICCAQYEQAALLMTKSDKKRLGKELKAIMRDAEKKDRKGVIRENGVGTNQKSRFLFAYDLYTMFVGELKVKQSFLDQCELDDGHKSDIDHLKACISELDAIQKQAQPISNL